MPTTALPSPAAHLVARLDLTRRPPAIDALAISDDPHAHCASSSQRAYLPIAREIADTYDQAAEALYQRILLQRSARSPLLWVRAVVAVNADRAEAAKASGWWIVPA